MNRLQTHEWASETDSLLDQARSVLRESTSEQVREMASRLPGSGQNEDAPIRLVFAGQYSSGKSTIIKALTGIDAISTGAGITTDQAQDYDWNGVVITDTPGIHTSIRPDHDEDSYRAISEADLLVFVITNELFDELIAQQYRKLTVDLDKGHETVVVVNKMNRHAKGNSPESRSILTEDLRQPLEPFSPEEIKLTFTDAESALEAVGEPDPEIAEMLEERGNIAALVGGLNKLVSEKGLSASQTTKLYSAQQVLSEALEKEESGNPDAEELLLVYNQNIRAIAQSAATIRGDVQLAIIIAKDKIKNAADEIIDILEAGQVDEAEGKATKAAEIRVREATEELDARIAKGLIDALPELKNRIETMQQGKLHQEVEVKLSNSASSANWGRGIRVIQSIGGKIGEATARIATNSTAVSAGVTGLGRFSGSAGHSAILAIGRTFGHSFQPWQAVRFTQTLSRAAIVLSIASVVIDIFLTIKEQRDEERREREALEARENVRDEFSRIAETVETEARNATEAVLKELLEDPLEEITKAREDLNYARTERATHIGKLNSIISDVEELIRQIHSESPEMPSERT